MFEGVPVSRGVWYDLNVVYNFPTWQYCKYKDIFDSRIIINSTAKFYISISYQKDLLSIDTRIFTPSS